MKPETYKAVVKAVLLKMCDCYGQGCLACSALATIREIEKQMGDKETPKPPAQAE